MDKLVYSFPPAPKNADKKIIEPSASFKQEVFKVAVSLFSFIFVYIILLVASLTLAAACAYGGVSLIISYPKFITLMLGLGLIGLGVMVAFFLLKFIFKKDKLDKEAWLEIKEHEHPELFNFIARVANETETPLPRKIYLSHKVNASVFYDSTFWSMFFPVKKNLLIGLGLVNCVNISEFKAIIAHEFGHFSQRSMKLGSYVFNLNKIVHNTLYDNEGYAKAIDSWGSASGYFVIFAHLTVKIVMGIQWILQKLYELVNKQYMGLSRQMEFHADAVSAYVSGSNHLGTSLRRIEVADSGFSKLISMYNGWISQNIKPENIFTHHTEVLLDIANSLKIPVENGLPQVKPDSFAHLSKSRIYIKDQWASHPEVEEREKHLNELHIETEAIHESAWNLFRNIEELQKRMTEKIYEPVAFKEKPQVLKLVEFKEKYKKEVEKNSLHSAYLNYYNAYDISSFDVNEEATNEGLLKDRFSDYFNEEALHVINSFNILKDDIHLMEWIVKKESGIKTFDFDGKKFNRNEGFSILIQLKEELKKLTSTIEAKDKEIFRFFQSRASTRLKSAEFKQAYIDYFKKKEDTENGITLFNEINILMDPLNGNVQIEEAKSIIRKVKIKENVLKEKIEKLLTDGTFKGALSEEQVSRLNLYISEDLLYFNGTDFIVDALDLFKEVLNIFVFALVEGNFVAKKTLLELQLTFLDQEEFEASDKDRVLV